MERESRVCQEAEEVLNNLPLHLGFWFDQPDRDPNDERNVATLTYEAFSLICPKKLPDRRIWSIGKLGHELRQMRREGVCFPGSFFEAASKMVVLELFHMGFLENKKGKNLNPATDSIHKNTFFRLKSTRKVYARAYEYFAFLGEVAGVDISQIEAHRRVARNLRD